MHQAQFEQVNYEQHRSIVLHDNHDFENYALHWHNAIEIIIPTEGTYTVICPDCRFELIPEDILILPAATLHHLPPRQGARYILLCDNDLFARNPVTEHLIAHWDAPVFIGKSHPHYALVREKTENLIRCCDGSRTEEIRMYTKLIDLFLCLTEQETVRPEQNGSDSKMQNILRYIDMRHTQPLTLDECAAAAGYSKFHFSRHFKESVGMSLTEYVNRKRVRAAELQLCASDLSVTDIAMQAGFSSLTTFNRVFRKIRHCTPTAFRQLCKTAHSTIDHGDFVENHLK